jgi:hypothetical protein
MLHGLVTLCQGTDHSDSIPSIMQAGMTEPTVAGLQDCVQQQQQLAPDELRQQHCRCTQEQMLQMFRDYDCWVFDCDGEAVNGMTPPP